MTKSNNKIIWIISVILLVLYDLTPSVPNFDSPYYLLAGEHLFAGRLDCLRTPTYPILVNSFHVLFGDNGMIIGLTILQSIVYLLSVRSLIKIIEKVIQNNTIRFATLLFYVIVIAPAWCNEIATESLSISGCIILIDFVIHFLEKPRWQIIAIAHLLLLFLVFLRPTFILFFAIFPCLWIFQWIKNHQTISFLFAILSTIICIGVWGLYYHQYEKCYGKRTSTISFECNTIYNLKRSGSWDLESVKNPQAIELCLRIDEQYSCNYDPIYQMVDKVPNSLPLISSACEDMICAHKAQYFRYRIESIVASFDTRFPGAVNTKSILGSILFFVSLFLSIPLSLFYLLVPLCVIGLLIYVVKRRKIPLIESLIVATVFAQYVGIVYSASEAYARLMLPVYGLFVVLIGIMIDKTVIYCSLSTGRLDESGLRTRQ